MIRRRVNPLAVAMLAAAALALAACERKPAAEPQAVGCTAAEMRTRRATSAACRAEFQALLDHAEADRRQASALPEIGPGPARKRF
ncbi:hypothetical protein [Caulobacter endophyticus]|uniref:Entry exclusion lipoprotein TrbK n=1 Tax=Caulobacter endophyticus TaxID=2172652 RepID=A0A2T9KCB7_9CAUL|nr:hypothetical protein [Caulobacter endophyticus]PVM93612.1 hypothetical protein DDF67_02675 [Caulobacter endophyticus]